MQFHLGKPILVMLFLALLSGAGIFLQRPHQHRGLTVWVFADSHAEAYRRLTPLVRQRTGNELELDLITARALDLRLTSLFMSAHSATELPDAAEVEISSIGRYFRPPVNLVGFLPLNAYLARSGWLDRIPKNRLAPWTKDGVIFGVPEDVHPVTIVYRQDLFREAGVDLESARTWPQFQELCLQFQDYWRARGMRYRHAMELHEGNADDLTMMLLQRHVNLIDGEYRVHINDPKVTRTLAFYAGLVAGPRRIGAESASGISGMWIKDLAAGNLCAMLMPDWRSHYLPLDAPELGGRLRMMPLPRFDPDDARTSTWGGTMIGIPRECRNPQSAWKLIEVLCFDPQSLDARFKATNILPPLVSEWSKPLYHQPDPFYEGGQTVFELYTELAGEIPPRYVTPATTLATAILSVAVNRAVNHVREHGTDGLELACQAWLDQAAEEIRRRVEHGKFDPADSGVVTVGSPRRQ